MEYRKPKMPLESVSSLRSEGRTVLKSIMDKVRAKKNPCQTKTV
jgi:hypothetical protein